MELRQILAANLHRMMKEHLDLDTQVKLRKRVLAMRPDGTITQSTIQRVLAADVHTSLGTLQKLADAFCVAPTELLTDRSASPEPAQEKRLTGTDLRALVASFNALPTNDKLRKVALAECTAVLTYHRLKQQLPAPTPEPIAPQHQPQIPCAVSQHLPAVAKKKKQRPVGRAAR